MYTLYVGVSPTPLRYRDFAHRMARCFTHAEARRLWMDTSFHPRLSVDGHVISPTPPIVISPTRTPRKAHRTAARGVVMHARSYSLSHQDPADCHSQYRQKYMERYISRAIPQLVESSGQNPKVKYRDPASHHHIQHQVSQIKSASCRQMAGYRPGNHMP